ncbi:MAG: serine/threonine-protein kinase [Gemmatimonas sp.]
MTTIEIPTPDPRTFDDLARPFAEAIAAQYAVKRVIGRGGMGVVYLARDRRLDRLVAIKTLLPELAADAMVRERFLRETRTAAKLAHPNIVPVLGGDEIDGHVYYSMAFVDGESLAAHIRGRDRLPANEVIRILRDVATGLAHAHRRGIVHRDIKAENILIERATGSAMVTDFGIARVVAAGPLTATGQLLGTVHYVSPEQVTGEPVDARSDIYSLGVIAYLALSGRFPFDSEMASAVLVAHVTKPVPSLSVLVPALSPSLVSVVERCLAKDPDDRFESADALLSALSAATSVQSPKQAKQGGNQNISTVVSNTEAHALWKRAAELQAVTGIQPRPLIIPRDRSREQTQPHTSGFRIEDIRSAANEAGIDASYVDHALAEHGLAPSAAVRPTRARSSLWAGIPLDIVKEARIDGEVSPHDFERFINSLRDATGTLGTTSARSRELAWRGKWFGHRLEASVVPDKGVTTIRLSQSVRRMAIATLISSFVVGGVVSPLVGWLVSEILRSSGPAWLEILSRESIETIAISAAFATVVASIPVGRRVLTWLRRRNDAELSVLAEALAEKARVVVGE